MFHNNNGYYNNDENAIMSLWPFHFWQYNNIKTEPLLVVILFLKQIYFKAVHLEFKFMVSSWIILGNYVIFNLP